MFKSWLHSALILLILLNGMGYTLIQVHFYLDREQITALHCINKDKPELECEGKCELGKRLSEAKNQNDSQAVITLEELNLIFLGQPSVGRLLLKPKFHFEVVNTPVYKRTHFLTTGRDFFHPPQG